jgi:hypothetical protein
MQVATGRHGGAGDMLFGGLSDATLYETFIHFCG